MVPIGNVGTIVFFCNRNHKKEIEEMKNTNRIVWADFLRLIAILMVVCIH